MAAAPAASPATNYGGPLLNPAANPLPVKVPAGETVYFCVCGQSSDFPYCNGAHVPFNQAHGTNIQPLKYENQSAEEVTKWICRCDATNRAPFCSGAHKQLGEKEKADIRSRAAEFEAASARRSLIENAKIAGACVVALVAGACAVYFGKKAYDAHSQK